MSVGSGGGVLQVEIDDHATVEVTGAVPLIASALTRTGITEPVDREKTLCFNTTSNVSCLELSSSLVKLTSQQTSNLPRMTSN